MSISRVLGFALAMLLLVKLVPTVAAVLWPGWRKSLARIQARTDLAGAVLMVAVTTNMWMRGEPIFALIVAVISLPVLFAAWRVIAVWWQLRTPVGK